MLGWIRWEKGRRIHMEREMVLGLPLLVLYLPERMRGQGRRAEKGAALLVARRVTRVLTPPAFAWWPVLTQAGLRPVETQSLRCMLLPVWVKAAMASGERPLEQAVIRLSGTRETPDMVLAAHRLCPVVRHLVIDTPGGETLAARLRREYGMPVLPARSVRADLTVRFECGPVMEGAVFALKGHELPADCEVLPLLSALWESGRIKTEDIAILV